MALCGSQNCACAVTSSTLSVTGSGTGADPWNVELSAVAPTLLPLFFTTTASRDAALPSPTEGTIAYTSSDNQFRFWDGAAWTQMSYTPHATTHTTYTPTWTGFTVGNGTNSGSWYRVGQLIDVRAKLLFGSTTTVTVGGTHAVSLPFTAEPSVISEAIITYRDLSTGDRVNGTAEVFNALVGGPMRIGSSGAVLSSTAPWTWAVNDDITVHVTYTIQAGS